MFNICNYNALCSLEAKDLLQLLFIFCLFFWSVIVHVRDEILNQAKSTAWKLFRGLLHRNALFRIIASTLDTSAKSGIELR